MLRLLFILSSIEIAIVPRETNISVNGISSKKLVFLSWLWIMNVSRET